MAYRKNRCTDDDVEPSFLGYQLIGDSQFLRFAERILNLQRKKKDGGTGYLGLCVSGQKVGDLLRRVRREEYPTSKKVIILIGTNDLLQQTDIDVMQDNFSDLLEELQNQGVSKMILLTCPPVPRLQNSSDHWRRLKAYNEHIQKLAKKLKGDISVIDAYSRFIRPKHRSSSSASSNRNSLNSSTTRMSSTTLIFPHDLSNNEPPKYKTNLRISVGAKRKVYELSEEESSSNRSSDSSPEYRYPKKRMHLSITEDDHNDRFVDDDSFSALDGIQEEIRMNLFEEYFSRVTKKVDKIHFNNDGLRVIKRLITNKLGG